MLHMNSSGYIATYRIHVKQALAQPMRIFAQVCISAIRVFFLFVIYLYVYSHTDAVAYPLPAALASVAMYNVLLALSLRRVFDVITTDVRSGAFEVSLLRPIQYLGSVLAAKLGTTVVLATITIALFVPLYFVFSPTIPDMSIAAVGWGLLLVAGGVALSGILYSLIALPVLWINDAEPFYYIVDKTILVLGGSYVPVALFPGWLKALSEYSPFGGAMFGTRMFDPQFLEYAPRLFVLQVTWIVVLTVFAAFLFSYARRYVSINGG